MAHYVYGVVEPSAKTPSGSGIAAAPLDLVEGEGAAALVSELPAGEVRFGREEMLAHSRVLEEAVATGTVLPMRFGLVMSDRDEIRERLLSDHALELSGQLEEFEGKVEIRIRAVYDEETLLREVLRENPEVAALRQAIAERPADLTYYSRIELGERIAAEVARRREHDGTVIREALAAGALAVDEGELAHERVALNASFLVGRGQLREFDEILEGIANLHGGRMRFKYTGPLPPYSFVQLAGRA